MYNITKEFLIEEYINKHRSSADIAKEIKCSKSRILQKLNEFSLPKHRTAKLRRDITGEKIGKWKIVGMKENNHHYSKTKWECVCECGNKSIVRYSHLVNYETNGCIACRSRKTKNNRSLNNRWTGFKEMDGRYLCHAKNGARQRNLEFSISIEDMWNQFEKQNRVCAISGIELKLRTCSNDKEANASLDRIDSNLGYTINNIQWVHKDINKMKMNLSQNKFIEYCYIITKYNYNVD